MSNKKLKKFLEEKLFYHNSYLSDQPDNKTYKECGREEFDKIIIEDICNFIHTNYIPREELLDWIRKNKWEEGEDYIIVVTVEDLLEKLKSLK